MKSGNGLGNGLPSRSLADLSAGLSADLLVGLLAGFLDVLLAGSLVGLGGLMIGLLVDGFPVLLSSLQSSQVDFFQLLMRPFLLKEYNYFKYF